MPEWLLMFGVTIAVPVMAVLVVRVFPRVLGDALIKNLEHDLNTKLERTKAELQAEYGSVKTSVDFLAAGQSELRSKTISAVENMWGSVLSIRSQLSQVVYFTSILTRDELDAAVRGALHAEIADDIRQWGAEDTLFSRLSVDEQSDIERFRIFVGDRLWLIFYISRAFLYRLGFLLHRSVKEERYLCWSEDDGALTLLRSVVEQSRIDEAKQAGIQALSTMIGILEAEFLKEAAKVMSGSPALAERLSDVHATIMYLHQRIHK